MCQGGLHKLKKTEKSKLKESAFDVHFNLLDKLSTSTHRLTACDSMYAYERILYEVHVDGWQKYANVRKKPCQLSHAKRLVGEHYYPGHKTFSFYKSKIGVKPKGDKVCTEPRYFYNYTFITLEDALQQGECNKNKKHWETIYLVADALRKFHDVENIPKPGCFGEFLDRYFNNAISQRGFSDFEERYSDIPNAD
jgi:hypothetical protein